MDRQTEVVRVIRDQAGQQRTPEIREFVLGHRRAIGLVAAALCVGLTILWWAVVPGEVDEASGIRAFVLRFGHPIVWAILAVASLLFALGTSLRWVGRVGVVALVAYAAFVVALVAP